MLDRKTIRSRIRAFHARALAHELELGTPADRRRHNADLITRTHFKDKLRDAVARKDIRASTLKKAMLDEGIIT